MSHKMEAPTETGAMNDFFEQKRASIEEYGKMFPKLLSGVAVEAMMAQGERLRTRRAKTPAEMTAFGK